MSEQSELEEWRKSVNTNLWSMDYGRGAKRGWQGCAARKNKDVKKWRDTQAAEIAALRGFANDVYTEWKKESEETLPFIFVDEIAKKYNLLDESGNPTPLLTGESE